MLLIGLDSDQKEHHKRLEIMNLFDIRIKRFVVINRNGKRFYRIESLPMRNGVYPCFGQYSKVHFEASEELLQRFHPNRVHDPELLEIRKTTRKRILDDVKFWHDFMESYIDHFGSFCLCDYDRRFVRYSPLTEKEITIDQWNEDHFLNLPRNQILVIHKLE